MFVSLRRGRWLIASVVIAASCSQGDAPGITGPSGPAAGGSGHAGILTGSAAGDVRTGPASLEIDVVRMDRQTPQGVSILRQYANPGQEYRMEVDETIELWVEYDRGDGDFPSGVAPETRRLSVDWGEGETERFAFTGCGPCKLSHTYPRTGRFTVRVTLDDRAGTTVTRTFFLNSLAPAPLPSPDAGCTTAPTLIPDPDSDVCDGGDGVFDASQFFMGSGLTYTLGPGFDCSIAGDPISIDPATGVITALTDQEFCLKVTATNACGSVDHEFDLVAFSACG